MEDGNERLIFLIESLQTLLQGLFAVIKWTLFQQVRYDGINVDAIEGGTRAIGNFRMKTTRVSPFDRVGVTG